MSGGDPFHLFIVVGGEESSNGIEARLYGWMASMCNDWSGLWYTRGSSSCAIVGSSMCFLSSREGNIWDPSSSWCAYGMHSRHTFLNCIKRQLIIRNLITGELDTFIVPESVGAIEELLILGE